MLGDWIEVRSYAVNTWYKVRLDFEMNTGVVKYYVNDVLVHTSIDLLQAGHTSFDEGYFFIDNWGSDVFFDNIKFVDTDAYLATESASLRKVNVFPNPASDFVTVNTDEKISSIEIFDASGRLSKLDKSGRSTLDLSSLKSGVYTLKVTTDKGTFNKKIIKK